MKISSFLLLFFLAGSACLLAQSGIGQPKDPPFCKEMLDSARAALVAKNWNRARDYCETALPLCPSIDSLLSVLLKQATRGVDAAKQKAVDAQKVAEANALLAKKKAKEAADERDKTGKTLKKLEAANAKVVLLILENARRDVHRLDYEAALRQVKAADELDALPDSVAHAYAEIAFFFHEARNPARAADLLDSAAAMLHIAPPTKDLRSAASAEPHLRRALLQKAMQPVAPGRFDSLLLRYYPDWVEVKGGEFLMGCDTLLEQYCDGSETLHRQALSDFKMAKTETTWWQYFLFCKATGHKHVPPGWGTDGDNPAVNVSWFDALLYANWLSEQLGKKPVYELTNQQDRGLGSYYYDVSIPDSTATGFRLPTEAQWEFAAKQRSERTRYIYSGGNDLDSLGWFYANSGSRTRPVARKKANALGLYDMSGNAWEWCWDWYDDYLTDPPRDYAGPTEERSYRVLRGGGWDYVAGLCRAARRNSGNPGNRSDDQGFRLAAFVP